MKQWPTDLKAVLFDMDGTLIDSEHIHFKNIVAVCADLGYDFTTEDDQRFMGHSMGYIFDALLPFFSRKTDFHEFMENNGKRFENIISTAHLFESVVDRLEYLKKADIPICVVTNGEERSAHTALTKTGIIDYFDPIITVAQVQHPKPHPEPYLMAAKQLNIPIEQCLIVEDSQTGVESAAAAGGYVVALDHTTHRHKLNKANHIVSKFAEIPFRHLFHSAYS